MYNKIDMVQVLKYWYYKMVVLLNKYNSVVGKKVFINRYIFFFYDNLISYITYVKRVNKIIL